MTIYIGAENILSPLGNTMAENFEALLRGQSAVRMLNTPYPYLVKLAAAVIIDEAQPVETRIESFIKKSITASLEAIAPETFNDRWLLVLSTTKGEIDFLKTGNVENARPTFLLRKIEQFLPFEAVGRVVSNACVSGLSATIYAADHLAAGNFDHALVVGADTVSEFTARGFASFYALDEEICKPFDAQRKGLNLGEGAASVVLSTNPDTYHQKPLCYLAGSTANDANHISGPSRTGEGLFRSIEKTLNASHMTPEEVDFISAHGTGTRYNDDMESHAITRAGLGLKPVNSLKGAYGHTLGASGLIELAAGMQTMRNNTIIKSIGCTQPGTDVPIHVALQNLQLPVQVMLKTASGFGGINASVILKKE